MPEKEIKNSKRFLAALTVLAVLAIALAIFLLMKLLNNVAPVNELGEPADSSNDQYFARLEKRQTDLLKEKSDFPKVTKEDQTLNVSFEKAETKSFTNCLDCGPEKDLEHFFIERFKTPAAVLFYRQFYEGDDQILLTASGQMMEIPSYPVFSPNKKLFVVVSAAEAFNWNGIELWEEESDGNFERKFHFEPKQSDLYRFLSWENDGLAKLEYSSYEAGPESKAICQSAELYKESGQWKMRDVKDQVRPDFCPYTEDWIPESLRRFTGPTPNDQ